MGNEPNMMTPVEAATLLEKTLQTRKSRRGSHVELAGCVLGGNWISRRLVVED